MPYFWRPYRRRWRRSWRRRPRKVFRRRYFWRRRQNRVRRKRKLQKITIKQWQPNTIKKLTVTGQYPLFCGTTERIGNDYTAYIDAIAPHDFPGGGLFSITIFTLNGLYELHQKSRNWWSKSNCNLPLIRYNGCTLKLYNSSSVDYVSVVVRCGELKATEQMFQSCQPSVLLLNRNKKVLLCKNYKKSRKGYKKWFIKPPSLLLNKWYFQKDIADYPLFMILTSAASLDRYFCAASSMSESIGFESLNTEFFELHGFKQTTTQPYYPNSEFALFAVSGHTTFENATVQSLILLGNPLDYSLGQPIGTNTSWETHVTTYFSKKTNWGNPFHPTYFGANIDDGTLCLLSIKTTSALEQLKKMQPSDKLQSKGFIKPTKPFKISCRYNPQGDMGHNALFITRITNDNTPWHEPADTHLVTKGLPLWLLPFGWHDYMVKAKYVQRLDTDYINVIVSDYIQPNHLTYYVPIDWFFLNGRSPYAAQDEIKAYDQQNWHPKANFQIQSISNILQCGPATAKLPHLISGEAHLTYKFHFKVGGCPPQMDEVCNPKTQPSYPQPGNQLSSILLQNPEYPIQYYISSFDQRRDILTERAAKRLKKDRGFKDTIFKPTGKTLMEAPVQERETSSESSSETEESQEEIQLQLSQHRHRQRKLQRRILQLLELLQT
nr:MAG: ORF1 [TTV-like mini virus]